MLRINHILSIPRLFYLVAVFILIVPKLKAQDTIHPKKNLFHGSIAIYPLPSKTSLGYRSNIEKRWAFDSKLGYTFSALPLLNIELNIIRRKLKNEIFNFYYGLGFTADGLTPGFHIPLGFEIKPFEKYKNIVFVAESSPKFSFSFSSGVFTNLSGNIGIVFFKPIKKKKHD